MKPSLFAFAGEQGAGKTTAARLLANILGWQYLSTSDTVIEMYRNESGISIESIKKYKNQFRPKLIELGDKDPMAVLRNTLAKAVEGKPIVLESIRRMVEFDYLTSLPQVNFLLINTRKDKIAERRGVVVADVNEALDEIRDYRHSYLVDNSGTMQELENRLQEIVFLSRVKAG